MAGSFDTYQVLYSDGPPTTPIRLGQLLVDESEASPFDMLKVCTSLSPLVYSSVLTSGGTGFLTGISAGDGITVDNTDPAVPEVSVDLAFDFIWTGAHQFTDRLAVSDLTAGTNEKNWMMRANGATGFELWATVDSNAFTTTGGSRALAVSRSGADLTTLTFGNGDNPEFVFAGTGDVLLNSDNQQIGFGAGNDLVIFFDGTQGNIASTSGDAIRIRAASGNGMEIANSAIVARFAATDSGRISHYTSGWASERGYWGFPTNGSDNMILRNIAGTTVQFRASNNTNIFHFSNTGVAFNGQSVIAPPNYTVTNPTTNRSIDVAGATLAQLRQIVGTVIQDFIDYGLYQ